MAAAFDEALGEALRYLAARERFEAELRSFLSAYPEDVRESVIDHLKGRRILSDTRVAEEVARRRSGKRSVGGRLLEDELLTKGASPEVAHAMRDRVDNRSGALAVLEGKFSKDLRDRPRAGRMLARRGFEPEEIESALDRFFLEDAS